MTTVLSAPIVLASSAILSVLSDISVLKFMSNVLTRSLIEFFPLSLNFWSADNRTRSFLDFFSSFISDIMFGSEVETRIALISLLFLILSSI